MEDLLRIPFSHIGCDQTAIWLGPGAVRACLQHACLDRHIWRAPPDQAKWPKAQTEKVHPP